MSYQSIFERMNRKEKRAFDNLPIKEKMDVFAQEYQNKMNASLSEQIPKAFYDGYLQAHEMLFDNYIVPMFELPEDEYDKIMDIWAELGKEIIRCHEIYTEKHNPEEKGE